MAIDKIIKIRGIPLYKVLKGYKVGYNLLWTNADRSLDGSIHATLIGEFPKIELEFIDGLTQEQVNQITYAVDAPFFSVEFWDSKKGQYRTAEYYRNDYTLELIDKKKQLYKGFSLNLIPTRRR